MIVSHEFNHPVEVVFRILSDPDFLKQRALKLGSFDAQCHAAAQSDSQKITLVRQRNVKVPAVLKSMLKSVQTATTEEQWQQQGEQYVCHNKTDIDGAPLSISGQITLSPSANGCLFKAEFEPDAKVRFFAGKLEKYAAKTIAKELELECEYLQNHLATV